jgi:hypothetical protein
MPGTEAIVDMFGLACANDLVLKKPHVQPDFPIKLLELSNLAESVCLYDKLYLMFHDFFFAERLRIGRILLSAGALVTIQSSEAIKRAGKRITEMSIADRSAYPERLLKRVLGWKVQVGQPEIHPPHHAYELVPEAKVIDGSWIREFHRRARKNYRGMEDVQIELTSHHVHSEELLDIPLASGPFLAKHYLRTIRVSESFQTYNLLLRVYREFARGEAGRDEALNIQVGTRRLILAPILAIVLKRASYAAEIPYALLEIREQLLPLRGRFAEYLALLREPFVPRKTKTKEVTRLNRSFTEFLKPYGSEAARFRMILDGGDGVSLREFLESELHLSEPLTESEFVKIIVKAKIPIDLLTKWVRKRRIGSLYSLRQEFNQIDNYSYLLNKIWHYQPTTADLETIRRMLLPLEEIWKHKAGTD